MFSRHTYLVIGLMVAGGAPYLSSQPAFQRAPFSSTETASSGEQDNVFRFASADGNTVVSPPSTNPFGNASVSSVENAAASGASPAQRAMAVSHSSSTENSAKLVSSDSASKNLPPVDGSQPIRFDEVFRLDVNSAWLMARWPRVTTGLADLELHGYRVSLLTGKKEDDLAGALTYYYDEQQVIQKLTFRGVTGDPRRLVHFCTSQYQFERQIVSDPALQVFRTTGSGRRPSELTVRPARVIRADAPRERFEVLLVLHR